MKKFFVGMIALLMTCLSILPINVFAEEGSQEQNTDAFTVVAPFDINTTAKVGYLNLQYDESFFQKSSLNYNHSLAQLSLGMAISSFRPVIEKEKVESSAYVLDFLTQCGFEDRRVDDYDKNPTLYTVSSVIGNKVVQNGDDSYTLVAIAICGGGYTNEWMSNLTIGDNDEHDGFSGASQKVFDRLFGYLAENQITGRIKIWCAGYSRAAAITNILAKKIDDCGQFALEDIFAYTFATPNTTKNPKQGSYNNIWNICGKMDPVPQVPLADWGYSKYGNILYTPAQETDSNYVTLLANANSYYSNLVGTNLWNNVDLNTEFRVILSHLAKICPDTATYTKYIQENLINIWQDKSLGNIGRELMGMATNPNLINEENADEANGLLNYISYTAFDMMAGGSILSKWNDESTILGNTAHEHTPEIYISWMMSTDSPSALFSDSLDTIRLVVSGDVNVAIYNQNFDFIKQLNADGTITYTKDDETSTVSTDIYMNRGNESSIIMLPRDSKYILYIESETPQTVELHSMNLRVGHFNSEIAGVYQVEIDKGNDCFIYSDPEENELYVDEQAFDATNNYELSFGGTKDYQPSSPSFAVLMERANVLNLTWRQTVMIAIALPVLVISIFAFMISVFTGKRVFKKKQQSGKIPASEKFSSFNRLLIVVAFAVFVLEETAFWIMPNQPLKKALIRVVINVCFLFVAYRGYQKHPNQLNQVILFALVFCGIGDIVMLHSFDIGLVLQIIAMALLAFGFYRYEKPDKWQYLMMVIAIIIEFGLITLFGQTVGANTILLVLYAVVTTIMVCESLIVPRKIAIGSILLFISSIIVFFNESSSITLLGHIISLGLYYVAITILATTFKGQNEPENIQL